MKAWMVIRSDDIVVCVAVWDKKPCEHARGTPSVVFHDMNEGILRNDLISGRRSQSVF